MPTLPDSGPWTIDEVFLLREATSNHTISTAVYSNAIHKVMDWDCVVEYMNKESRKHYISNRKYTAEECCDNYIYHWVLMKTSEYTYKTTWKLEDMELLQEALIACRARNRPTNGKRCGEDWESVRLFMNTKSFERGTRGRYYTLNSMKYISSKQFRSKLRSGPIAPNGSQRIQGAAARKTQIEAKVKRLLEHRFDGIKDDDGIEDDDDIEDDDNIAMQE